MFGIILCMFPSIRCSNAAGLPYQQMTALSSVLRTNASDCLKSEKHCEFENYGANNMTALISSSKYQSVLELDILSVGNCMKFGLTVFSKSAKCEFEISMKLLRTSNVKSVLNVEILKPETNQKSIEATIKVLVDVNNTAASSNANSVNHRKSSNNDFAMKQVG